MVASFLNPRMSLFLMSVPPEVGPEGGAKLHTHTRIRGMRSKIPTYLHNEIRSAARNTMGRKREPPDSPDFGTQRVGEAAGGCPADKIVFPMREVGGGGAGGEQRIYWTRPFVIGLRIKVRHVGVT